MTFSLILTLFLILVLLILSAIFSSSETSIVASSRGKIHNLVKEGNKNAKIVVFLQKNLGQIISSLLIGNNLVNILATTLTTGLLVRLFGESGVVYANIVTTVVMGSLIVFYCEMVPKILALHYPEKIALTFSKFLKLIYSLLNPLTKFLTFCAKINLKAVGVDLSHHHKDSSMEEIRGLIDLQVASTNRMQKERNMLHGILDLATVDVDEVMTHRKEVAMVDIAQGPEKIIKYMLSSPFTRVPIYRDDPDNIIGVLHIKALFKALRACGNDPSRVNLYEIATKPWFVPETTALLDQLEAFRRRREHFACVVDEYGSFIGIITLEDILEEIVGEIADEHDIEIPGVRVSQDGSIVVVGTVTIRDLNRQFGWDLSDEEAVTIAGLLIHKARRIPEVGQSYKINSLTIRVLRKQRNQITLLRIYNDKEKKQDA